MYPLDIVLIGCGDAWTGGEHSLRSLLRRELTNMLVLIKGEFRDVENAIKSCQLADGEHVLFLMNLRTLDDLKQLQRLSAAYKGQPILALRDAASDRQLFLGALQMGAAFAVPVPFSSEDFKTALDWVCRNFGFAPRPSTLIAVAGVNGAAGATTLALNLAADVAGMGRNCIVAELAFRLGVLATYLDLEPQYTLSHVLDDLERLDIELVRRALMPIVERLSLLAGPHEAIQPRALPTEDLLRLVRYLRALAEIVVVDVPCTYDDLYFEALARADKVVLVAEQKLPSIRALIMVRDALNRRQVSSDKQFIVVNRYNPQLPGFRCEELGEHLRVPHLYTIANDPAIAAALDNGRTLHQQAPGSPALADISKLARPLLDLRALPTESPGLIRRVVRSFGMKTMTPAASKRT